MAMSVRQLVICWTHPGRSGTVTDRTNLQRAMAMHRMETSHFGELAGLHCIRFVIFWGVQWRFLVVPGHSWSCGTHPKRTLASPIYRVPEALVPN